MADERSRSQPEPIEEAPDGGGEEPEVVVGRRLGGLPEPREVEGDHRVARRQCLHRAAPRFSETAQAVEEDDGGTAAGAHIMKREAVEGTSAES